MASFAAQISSVRGLINAYQAQLNSTNESLESLQRFKTVIERSQSDYHSCMSAKKSALGQVEPYCVNTKCNTKYKEGMSTRLNGIGAVSVSVTYVAFLAAINVKIGLYRARISSLNSMIQNCNNTIRNLQEQQRLENERLERERQERERQAQNQQ